MQLVGDLSVDVFAGIAVDRLVNHPGRPAVQRGQLHEVGVRYETGQRPRARAAHFHLALYQRLGHMQIGEQGAAFEQPGPDMSAGSDLELGEKVAEGNVARMRGRGVQRAAEFDGRIAARMAQDAETGDGGNGRTGKGATRNRLPH